MKFLTIALLVFSTAAFANGPAYYENDGTAPELFKSKSNEVLNEDQAEGSKKIIRSTTTTVEQQEDETSTSTQTGTGAGTQTTQGTDKELKVTDENKHLMQNVPKKGMNVEKQEALGGEEPLDVGIPTPEESNTTP